jgi:hypothetical protein
VEQRGQGQGVNLDAGAGVLRLILRRRVGQQQRRFRAHVRRCRQEEDLSEALQLVCLGNGAAQDIGTGWGASHSGEGGADCRNGRSKATDGLGRSSEELENPGAGLHEHKPAQPM